MAQNWIAREEDRTLHEILFYFDRLLVDQGVVAPVLGQYLLRAKPS